MDEIFDSLKTFVFTKEDMEACTELVSISGIPAWNKGIPKELNPLYGRTRTFSKEHRKKLSIAAMGKSNGPLTKEHKAKISASRKGQSRIIGEEHRKKISASNKGKPKILVSRIRDKKVMDVQNFHRYP